VSRSSSAFLCGTWLTVTVLLRSQAGFNRLGSAAGLMLWLQVRGGALLGRGRQTLG
jgi:hypothetical protein